MGSQFSIELVEDHLLFAQALAEVICEEPDFAVVGIAATGDEALRIAHARQPQVIVLDYHLPGVTAVELLPGLRSAAPKAQILVLTSDTSTGALESAMAAGANGFMTKGEAIDGIVASIRTRIRVSQPQPTSVLDGTLIRLPLVGSFVRTAAFVRRLERQPGVGGAWIHSMSGFDALVRVTRPGPNADIYAAMHGAAEDVKARLE
ncbi:MAG: response regulator transcription factor [Chloroflexi bacterium]|nr:response regulator transcription factor [Chloroflexota bacterium]